MRTRCALPPVSLLRRPGPRSVRWTALLLLSLVLLFKPVTAHAQLCVTKHTSDLYCLIPATFHTAATPFQALYTPFGTELGELPIARSAVSVPIFRNNVMASTNATNSLGTVFSEQAESLPKHHIFLGVTYQNFTFGHLDNNDLKRVPIVLYDPSQQVYTVTQSRFDIRVGQYTALIAAGLTDWLDVSAAIPVENVSFAATVTGTEYSVTGGTAGFTEHVPGTASGFGDVQFGTKATVLNRRGLLIGVGTDLRLPTGDELNVLGSGAVGVRPYAAIALAKRVSPHLNVGYQYNRASILNADTLGNRQQLPTDFFYNAGAEFSPGKNWTLVADLLGKHFFDSPRLSAPVTSRYGPITATSVLPYYGSYTANDLSLGFKSDRLDEGHLIITGNATIALNFAGLRARVVPLVGISYAF